MEKTSVPASIKSSGDHQAGFKGWTLMWLHAQGLAVAKCRKMICRLGSRALAGLVRGSLALTVSCVVTLTPNFEARARTMGLMGNPGKVSDVNNECIIGNRKKGVLVIR